MVQVSYPGVYIQEIPSTSRPIAAVSTSVAAFIDWFREGPMNKAVEVFGMADFERVFSGVDVKSDASYAISQFFLNGGSRAYVVRVTPPLAGGAVTVAATAGVTVLSATAGSTAFDAAALNEGVWGNGLRIAIDPIPDATTSGVSTSRFSLYVYRYASATDLGAPLATEKYLNLSTSKSDPRYYVDVVNNASQLARLTALTPDILPAVTGTIGPEITATLDFTSGVNGLNGKTFTIKVGADPVARTARLSWTTANAPTDLRTLRGPIETAIRTAPPVNASNRTFDASYAGATVELVGKKYLVRAGHRSAGYAPNQLVTLTAAAPVDTVLGATSPGNVQEYVLGAATVANTAQQGSNAGAAVAGADGSVPNADALKGQRSLKTGMYALEDADIFNLLCMPRVSASDFTTNDFTAVVSDAIAYCEEKRAVLLVDIPATVHTVQAMKDWTDVNASTIRSKNAVVYYPRLEIPDPKNEYRLRSVGPSGTMAGVYARTDTERGVWKAPAGIEAVLRGVGGLDDLLTDLQNGALNPLGINCMRNLPVYGQVAWGARTLFGADVQASEWKYIPIRRLALMIEESLFRGTKWVVFEPNDEPLWAKIRQNVGAFMMNLFRQGAFQGSTPDKAFFVKCDAETTTAIDRNLGIVNVEVGFAPLKPAEFVVLKIQQIPDLT